MTERKKYVGSITNELIDNLVKQADNMIVSNLGFNVKRRLRYLYLNKSLGIDPFFWNNGALSLAIRKFEETYNETHTLRGRDKLFKFTPRIRQIDDVLYFYANYDHYDKSIIDTVFIFLKNFKKDNFGSILYRHNNETAFIDTLGMVCPFLSRYGADNNSKSATELAVKQYRLFFKHGFDEILGLPYHGYNSQNRIKEGIVGWGRGVGWALLGLVGTLQWTAPTTAEYFELDSYFRSLIKSVMRYQRSDGSFSWQLQAVDGHEDTSATAMIGYAISRYNSLNNKNLFQRARTDS